uniref:Uncharacterized protein n=1 Tax=Utricularia reniformis TaxID=192314 RepID=A0A1Y0B3P3_9LAMI|nr:hypothetical protein AEK19_MT1907 [Utricularia reniformis]ART32075.1 hypothetical protein AEK19_MT1907 [Utricularia reniformis]
MGESKISRLTINQGFILNKFLSDRFFFMSHQSKLLASQANKICLCFRGTYKLDSTSRALDHIEFVIEDSTHAKRLSQP